MSEFCLSACVYVCLWAGPVCLRASPGRAATNRGALQINSIIAKSIFHQIVHEFRNFTIKQLINRFNGTKLPKYRKAAHEYLMCTSA